MKRKNKKIPEIKLAYTSGTALSDKPIRTSKDAATIFRKLISPKEIELREQLIVLCMRGEKVIGYYRHSTGGLTGTVLDARLILATALKSLSTALIICHNHPSGSLRPSPEDELMTTRLQYTAKQMGITLADHLILTKKGYYSFADENNLGLEGTNHTKKEAIILLDLFSGTGGFAKGFEEAGFHIKKHYYSEIDTYAIANYRYNFKNAINLGDVTKINAKKIERPTVITFGSPCQDISIAGKRKGLVAKRSGLFFEAVRIIRECRPQIFIFENVKGLFSSNQGKDFEVVLQTFADLGLYDIQWQLLNTCRFLPQNRERIYLVGSLRGTSRQQIFPIGESDQGDQTLHQKESPSKTLSPTIDTKVGESVHRSPYVLHWKGSSTKWKYGKMKTSPALNTQQDWIRNPLIATGAAYRTRTYKGQAGKIEVRKDKNSNQLTTVQKDSMVLFRVPEATKKGYATAREGDSINLTFLEANRRRGRVGKGIANTIDTGARQYTIGQGSLRRLTPVECERLQGFPDNWTKYGIFDGAIKEISDAQRYKMLGNAVTVAVVQAIAERLLPAGKSNNPATQAADAKQVNLLTLELELELSDLKHAA
jgi:DNA (cytosine-5)-methyltransferase 1